MSLQNHRFCSSHTAWNKPFDGVFVDPFSFAGVPCGDDVSSLPVMPPFPRRLIGLSEGGFGNDGRVGLVGGGPGVASSMMWAHMFSNLPAANQSYAMLYTQTVQEYIVI